MIGIFAVFELWPKQTGRTDVLKISVVAFLILVLIGSIAWLSQRYWNKMSRRAHQLSSVIDFQSRTVFSGRAKVTLSPHGSYISMIFIRGVDGMMMNNGGMMMNNGGMMHQQYNNGNPYTKNNHPGPVPYGYSQ